MLQQHQGQNIQVFMVWEAVLPTDSDPPNDRVLARASDQRVWQYWDPDGALSKAWQPALLKETTPVVGKQELVTGEIVWDFAAVYPPGPRWAGTIPPAKSKAAPVAAHIADVASAL